MRTYIQIAKDNETNIGEKSFSINTRFKSNIYCWSMYAYKCYIEKKGIVTIC